MDEIDGGVSMSERVRQYLERKLKVTSHKIKNEKLKKRIIQTIAISTAVSSIVISAIVASLTVPPLAISILSASSAVLTGVNLRFNFQNKTKKLKRLIDSLTAMQSKLDYVVSCNGSLELEEYEAILKEF